MMLAGLGLTYAGTGKGKYTSVCAG